MTFSNEPIPSLIVKTMLDTDWETYGGDIPKPSFIDPNDGTIDGAPRFDLSRGDCIVIRMAPSGEQETYRDAWEYVDRIVTMELEIHTGVSRQRLYNLKQEARRILHYNKHNMDDYQIIRYRGFNEMVNEQQRVWEGRISLSLETVGQTMEV